MESLSTVGTYNLSFREVLPHRTTAEKWKEITVNVGSSQSTLRDIKVPEKSGGYSYKDVNGTFTRNRFIYWRICHDVLEIAENSLDFNLAGDSVRYKFQNSPILEGISIFETKSRVVILVTTVSSVHKLSFPHPNEMYSVDYITKHHPDLSLKSIFHDASLSAAKDPSTFYVIDHTTTNSPLPHCAASLFTMNKSCLFALAYSTGTITLVDMDKNGEVDLKEIKETSIFPRFLKGILRGKTAYEMAVSMVLHAFDVDYGLFSLHRDGVLRMWSCNSSDCLAEIDIASNKTVNGVRPTEGVQPHIMKKTSGIDEGVCTLCVYLNFSQFSEVHLIKLVNREGTFVFENVFVIDALPHDLIDLSIGSQRIWALWRTTEGNTLVSSIVLNYKDHGWQFSLLEKLPSIEACVSAGMDIAEECLNYIFYPGRFPLSVITKAVTIFRRSTVTASYSLSLRRLKQIVILAIEAEIDKDPLNKELNDIDKLDLVYQTWLRFYSCCVQLYEAHTRPLGLLPLHSSGIVLVKKQEYSLLRPMETLEYMLLAGSELIAKQTFHLLPPERKQYDVMQDLILLMSVLIALEERLPEDMKEHFMEQMQQQKSPDQVAEAMLHELTAERAVYDNDFLINIGKKLNGIKNLYSTLVLLIDTLTLKQCSLRGEAYENTKEAFRDLGPSLKYVYSSSLAVPAIAMSLHQFVTVRYSICRSLLLLQQLLLCYHKKLLFKIVDSQYADVLHNSLVPSVVLAAQSYFVLLWACTTTIMFGGPPSSAHDSYFTSEASTSLSRSSSYQRTVTVLEAYLQQWNNTVPARTWLDYWAIEDFSMWHSSMLAYTTLLCQQLWPVWNNFDLPNFLLSVGQCTLVQQYMRLLDSWCESYASSRKYLHGLALLQLGHHHKALDCLVQASAGMEDAVFLELIDCQNADPERLQVQYYLNLIKKFEMEKHWDSVINLATIGLSKAKTNEDICTFQSIIFLQHMKLGHYVEAFYILPQMPVSVCRHDCMRQAIVTLTERNHFDYLLEFPCQDMYSEFESILLSRARTMDLQDSPYYNFMYSFFIKRGQLWDAAKVMYEQGFRLGREGDGTLSTIETQSHCYLAAINILSLLDEDVAWVVKPIEKVPMGNGLLDTELDELEEALGEEQEHEVQLEESHEELKEETIDDAIEVKLQEDVCDQQRKVNEVPQQEQENDKDVEIVGEVKERLTKEERCRRALAVMEEFERELEEELEKGVEEEMKDEEMLKCERKDKVQLLTVNEVRKEYKVVMAKIRLMKFCPREYSNMAPGLGVNDFVAVLTSVGLYELALELCDTFSLSMQSVFEALTMTCISLSTLRRYTTEDLDYAWQWLHENGVSNIVVSEHNIVNLAWGLLETLCEKYEGQDDTQLHKAIAERLLLLDMQIPHWIQDYYCQYNPTEYLRLLLRYGQFENAAALAEKYLQTAMGVSHHRFGMKHTLRDAPFPTYVPIHLIDVLLLEMDGNQRLQEAFESLTKLKDQYIKTVTSENITLFQRRRNEE
ncbi:nuclear pore complex protein Nup160 homolog [Schistocerca americana]|uniref:nuclear pore complex protein Nup160 homolog n=1 Tax=Schistocerca americana TaxID=7009 RepID=UPI001F4FE558|nr:nuclear pore complex protein Nup160 homolog [Schistocerca americana]XP_049963190.1 nuclear pore complex protein Nup160 homolog [Schistocerca serialis cubense]